MLEVKNLNFKYDEISIFDKFNFSGNNGEIIMLRGKNGSGKTTLLKCIAGIINGGKSIFIRDVELVNDKSLIKNISYIMSEDTLYEYLTVKENIQLFCELFREKFNFVEKIEKMFKELELEEYNNYLVKHLSKGTRQKIYLIIMLSRDAQIFLLDEPFSSLDLNTQSKIKNKLFELSEKGALIVYSTHVSEFSSIATRECELQSKEE